MFIYDWRTAEAIMARWMRHNGYWDARTTGGSSDGGIDIESVYGIAQVKFHNKPTGRPDLQRLVGARMNRQNVDLLFFSFSGFTQSATKYADEMRIAAIRFDTDGSAEVVNKSAESVVRSRRLRREKLHRRAARVGIDPVEDIEKLARAVVAAEKQWERERQEAEAREKAARRAARAQKRAARAQRKRERSAENTRPTIRPRDPDTSTMSVAGDEGLPSSSGEARAEQIDESPPRAENADSTQPDRELLLVAFVATLYAWVLIAFFDDWLTAHVAPLLVYWFAYVPAGLLSFSLLARLLVNPPPKKQPDPGQDVGHVVGFIIAAILGAAMLLIVTAVGNLILLGFLAPGLAISQLRRTFIRQTSHEVQDSGTE